MIAVYRNEIPTVQLGEISHYNYMVKSHFISARRGSFSLGICLDLYTFSLNFAL